MSSTYTSPKMFCHVIFVASITINYIFFVIISNIFIVSLDSSVVTFLLLINSIFACLLMSKDWGGPAVFHVCNFSLYGLYQV